MTVGRNDPCPCGSGKKYKKCCLGKKAADEAKPRPTVPEERPSLPEQRPTDPATEASNARWKEFESEDHEGQIALFTRTLDEEELMDEEVRVLAGEPLFSARTLRASWLTGGVPASHRRRLSPCPPHPPTYALPPLAAPSMTLPRAPAQKTWPNPMGAAGPPDSMTPPVL